MNQRVDITIGTKCFGYTTLDILPQLTGRPLDDISKALIATFNPTYVIKSKGEVHADAVYGRVTVFVEQHKLSDIIEDVLSEEIITRIYQEIQIELPEGIRNGHEFNQKLKVVHMRNLS